MRFLSHFLDHSILFQKSELLHELSVIKCAFECLLDDSEQLSDWQLLEYLHFLCSCAHHVIFLMISLYNSKSPFSFLRARAPLTGT
jgi:hypothetical protein